MAKSCLVKVHLSDRFSCPREVIDNIRSMELKEKPDEVFEIVYPKDLLGQTKIDSIRSENGELSKDIIDRIISYDSIVLTGGYFDWPTLDDFGACHYNVFIQLLSASRNRNNDTELVLPLDCTWRHPSTLDYYEGMTIMSYVFKRKVDGLFGNRRERAVDEFLRSDMAQYEKALQRYRPELPHQRYFDEESVRVSWKMCPRNA